ncbi:hypothetical protein Q1695_003858 [Nippostrongylus brasiliensis]|nr:hypothetical protein Q1695_003858 [Nippostrongylus brasiliensis]
MDHRVEASLSFLTLWRTHSWLGNFITGDEKGVLFYNVHRRAQWVDKGDEAEDVTKPSMHVKKVMLCIWWSVYGVEYWELLDEGKKVTAKLYVSQLQKLKAHLQLTRGEQANIYFQHDNASPHTARSTKAELLKYGWKILPHPPYSPDLSFRFF